MKKIIFATQNEGKMREIRMILADLGVPVLSLKEAGIEVSVEENGNSFEENAIIKARAVGSAVDACGQSVGQAGVCEQSGARADTIVLADDSGLEIDYLNREPGIYSARYLGEDTSYEIKNRNLIDRLAGVPDDLRTARFVCVIAAVAGGQVLTARGTMEGRIAHVPAGENGFGYDPIFYLPEYGCTSAELSADQKNEISHRGKALRAIRGQLENLL